MDLNFTEEEVQKTAEFVNFVFKNAKFELDSKQVLDLNRMFTHMHGLIKKMDGYILEVKQTRKKPTEDKK